MFAPSSRAPYRGRRSAIPSSSRFPATPTHGPLLQGVWSSLVFDYVARQKLSGTHMKYFTTKQLACPAPEAVRRETGLVRVSRSRTSSVHGLPSWRTRQHRIRAVRGGRRRTGPRRRPFGGFRSAESRSRPSSTPRCCTSTASTESTPSTCWTPSPPCASTTSATTASSAPSAWCLPPMTPWPRPASTGVPFLSPLDPPPGHGPRHEEQM